MILQSLSLQNFRNYTKQEFTFNKRLTIIVGPNAVGKTNLVEAISMLSIGKSFRTEKEKQLVQFGKPVARVKCVALNSLVDALKVDAASIGEDMTELEVVVYESSKFVLQKKYLVNGVSKRRADFAGKLPAVLFTPLDLEIVGGQPGNRRRFLDTMLEQVDRDYRVSLSTYMKALRQRNALLDQVQRTGVRDERYFAYWDNLLIKNGSVITQKREEAIAYINKREKRMFSFRLVYDKSIMSEERLSQYKHAEVGAGSTLVGPQRDDVIIQSYNADSGDLEDVKYFCSRGQQRLVTLELKLSQISFIKERIQEDPLLVLDDIFSELDSKHIAQVLHLATGYQTIITTTHKEFVQGIEEKDMKVINLESKV